MPVADAIAKSRNQESFTQQELEALLALPPTSPESYQLMAAASELSRELQQNEAEVHGQLALNLAPCPEECQFCSFAKSNKVFTRASEVPLEDAVAMGYRDLTEVAFAQHGTIPCRRPATGHLRGASWTGAQRQ